jgi:hypothetical protein
MCLKTGQLIGKFKSLIFAILSLSMAAAGIEPSVFGTLVECSTHTPKTEGSNPAAATERYKMAKTSILNCPVSWPVFKCQ